MPAGGAFPRGGAGFGGGLVAEGGRTNGGTGGRMRDELPGKNALTIVHGVVDAPEVRVCFRAGTRDELRVVETPSGAESLEFGAALVLPELEGVDFETEDLQPVLVTGELSLVEDVDCSEAIERAIQEQQAEPGHGLGGAGAGGADGVGFSGAGGHLGGTTGGGTAGELPSSGSGGTLEAGAGGAAGGGTPSDLGNGGASSSPPELAGGFGGEAGEGGAGSTPPIDPPKLRAGFLPVIPAGTLASGRSWLLVPNGCIGGPAFSHRMQTDACGDGYTPQRPTLGAMLVPMSRRLTYNMLGLQFAHGSVATGAVTVRSAPSGASSEVPLTVADRVTPGIIVPQPARTDLPAASWGAGLSSWNLEVIQGGALIFGVPWPEALERGGVEHIEDGSNYVVVLVGPRVDLDRAGFWNRPTMTVVASEP